MKDLEKQLKALANRRRLSILKILKVNKDGVSVSRLAREINLSFRSTSRHLKILSDSEIIDRNQRGLNADYFLSTNQELASKKILDLL